MSYVETSAPVATMRVPSVVADMHRAHMARIQRFKSAAIGPKPPAPVNERPVKILTEPTWEERQRAIPIPKGPWFSVVEMGRVDGPRRPTIGDVQRTVAKYFKLTIAELICARRTKSVVIPRHIAMALCREMTLESYPNIGRRFRRDHTVPIYAFNKICELVKTDASVAADYESLKAKLGGSVE